MGFRRLGAALVGPTERIEADNHVYNYSASCGWQGMDEIARSPDDFASAFEAAFARLQVQLEMACTSEGLWHERAIVAIHEALEFSSAEPEAARVLTSEALAQGVDGIERYERLMSYIAGLLEAGRAESPHGAELPATTERSLAGGVVTIIANRVVRERASELPGLIADVVQFVLTPYMGKEEARRIAAQSRRPRSQPDR